MPESSDILPSPTKQLSILLVSDDFLPMVTGVGQHLLNIGPALVQRGHRVCLLTSRRPGQPEYELWRGIHIYRIFSLKIYGFYQAIPMFSTIRHILAKHQPDLIHQHYWGFMLYAVAHVARSLGIPQIYTYHMLADHITQPWPLRPWRSWVDRHMTHYCNSVQQVISVSQELKQVLHQKGIKTAVNYISNPVVFPALTPNQQPERESDFQILYVGRLNREKNLPFLLQGVRALIQRCPRVLLQIAGTGSEVPVLKALVHELGIEKHVRFLGFIEHDRLPTLFTSSDVFVNPSLVETQCIAVMEAMSLGKPIIVTSAVVSAKELIREGVNGFIVNPNSVQNLIDKLFFLATHPNSVQTMGQHSRQYAQEFQLASVVKKLEQIYCQVYESNTTKRHKP